ncbi:hypothetical protein, partial [Mesorhizobium sp.]|uniref:hypothetical protein n=2 Tax=Mesorhizobium sp. TaxID=1871066 RepID=UPI00257D5C36
MATIRGLMPDASETPTSFSWKIRLARCAAANRLACALASIARVLLFAATVARVNAPNDPRHQVGRDWFTISDRSCDRAVETFVASLPIQIGPQLVGLAG